MSSGLHIVVIAAGKAEVATYVANVHAAHFTEPSVTSSPVWHGRVCTFNKTLHVHAKMTQCILQLVH